MFAEDGPDVAAHQIPLTFVSLARRVLNGRIEQNKHFRDMCDPRLRRTSFPANANTASGTRELVSAAVNKDELSSGFVVTSTASAVTRKADVTRCASALFRFGVKLNAREKMERARETKRPFTKRFINLFPQHHSVPD